jgi:hypothetical protein
MNEGNASSTRHIHLTTALPEVVGDRVDDGSLIAGRRRRVDWSSLDHTIRNCKRDSFLLLWYFSHSCLLVRHNFTVSIRIGS